MSNIETTTLAAAHPQMFLEEIHAIDPMSALRVANAWASDPTNITHNQYIVAREFTRDQDLVPECPRCQWPVFEDDPHVECELEMGTDEPFFQERIEDGLDELDDFDFVIAGLDDLAALGDLDDLDDASRMEIEHGRAMGFYNN